MKETFCGSGKRLEKSWIWLFDRSIKEMFGGNLIKSMKFVWILHIDKDSFASTLFS